MRTRAWGFGAIVVLDRGVALTGTEPGKIAHRARRLDSFQVTLGQT